MTEQLTSSDRPNNTAYDSVDENERYLDAIAPYRTARGASEAGYDSPAEDVVNVAVREIRKDITPVFIGATNEVRTGSSNGLDVMKEKYWQRASRVGVEHGTKDGYDLDGYFTVGNERSYDDIKNHIEEDYDEGSVVRSVLDGIDLYHQVLKINPAHAATIMMEMLGRNLKEIKQSADGIVQDTQCLPKDASAVAIADFVTDYIPEHLNMIITSHGYGDEAVHSAMNKASFYPAGHEESAGDVSLTLSSDDAAGLVEVYNIQSRPYDDAALELGNKISQLPAMQSAMLQIHEGLVEFSDSYLQMHPDRAAGDMRNFSEIFVPERNGGKLELLPNPKLILAMVNNVMPGIAMSILRRGGTLESLNTDDVVEGVKVATGEFMLFQARMGQLDKYNPDDETVQLESTFKVVCPAGGIFPNYLKAKLASYYEEASALQKLDD